jgi:3-hydroxyacyl-CoA dehydrogenase
MVAAGRYGRKTGHGVYQYDDKPASAFPARA